MRFGSGAQRTICVCRRRMRCKSRRRYLFRSGAKDCGLKRGLALVLLVLGIAATGCGYRVAGRANTLPPNIKTIAVTAFENRTSTYRIEQRLTDAVVHEFLVDTRYRVASNAADGDAVLRG